MIQEKKFTYQATIVTDTTNIYLLINYQSLGMSGAVTGYSFDEKCEFEAFAPVTTSEKLQQTSNIGKKGLHVFSLSDITCSFAGLYKHGENVGDKILPPGDNSFVQLQLEEPIPLFSSTYNQIYISVDGVISIEPPSSSFTQRPIPNAQHSFIAILSVDMDTTKIGTVFYRESRDQQTLGWASKEISRFIWKSFIAKQAVVFTFLGVPVKNSHNIMTFQAVLASDGKETYLISHYKWHPGIHEQGIMGYSNKLCDWNWFRGRGDSMKSTYLYTNTGFKGQYIFPVFTKRCMNEVLLPFGTELGDSMMIRGDDAAISHTLKEPFPFFTKSYPVLYIGVNSVISVNQPKSYSSAHLFQNNNLLVIMYKDFTIQDGGCMFFRETTTQGDLHLYEERIRNKTTMNVTVKRGIIITYVNLQEVAVESSRYTFQAVLLDTEAGFYGIINYYRISSDGGATSGYYDKACKKPSVEKLKTPTVKEVEMTNYVQVFPVKPCDLVTGILDTDFITAPRMRNNQTNEELSLSMEIQFFGKSYKKIYINRNGFISFGKPVSEENQISIPYDKAPIIALYSTRLSLTSDIFFQQTKNSSLVSLILKMTSFKAKNIIIITYKDISSFNNSEPKNTFQLFLAYDELKTYGIFYYKNLETQDATVGWSAPGCSWRLFESLSNSVSMMSTATEGEDMGRHVFIFNSEDTKCEPFKGFYPYGKHIGDVIKSGDKDATEMKLLQDTPFLGKQSTKRVYLNSGILSTNDASWDRLDASSLRSDWLIGLFGTQDFNLELGGDVFYRTTNQKDILKAIDQDIKRTDPRKFQSTSALIITYILVPTRDLDARHMLQVTIATDQIQTYAIMNYRQLGLLSGLFGVNDMLCRRYDLRETNSDTLIKTGYFGQHVIKITPYRNCYLKVYPTIITTTTALSSTTTPKSPPTTSTISTTELLTSKRSTTSTVATKSSTKSITTAKTFIPHMNSTKKPINGTALSTTKETKYSTNVPLNTTTTSTSKPTTATSNQPSTLFTTNHPANISNTSEGNSTLLTTPSTTTKNIGKTSNSSVKTTTKTTANSKASSSSTFMKYSTMIIPKSTTSSHLSTDVTTTGERISTVSTVSKTTTKGKANQKSPTIYSADEEHEDDLDDEERDPPHYLDEDMNTNQAKSRDANSENFIKEAIIISASLVAVFIIIVTIYILVKRGITGKRRKPSNKLREGDVLLKNRKMEIDIQMDLHTPDHLPPPEGF
ncbi:uncharacterized protein [Clytia hemisphaerica]